MITLKSYIDYFRAIAVAHVSIAHNPLAENQDTDSGDCYFGIFDLADVFTKLKSSMGSDRASLLVHPYEIKGSNKGGADNRLAFTGGFVVAKKAAKFDIIDRVNAQLYSEQTTLDIVGKMISDCRNSDGNKCNTPFENLQLDNFDITPVGPIWENHYGWHVEFSFTMDANIRLHPASIGNNFST